MNEPTNKPARQAEDVVSVIGREIAAMQGALLALTSVMARSADPGLVARHLQVIRESAAREPNSSHFTDILDKMIDVARPAVH